MKHETIERATKGLWINAALCWLFILVFLGVVAITQAGCATGEAFGRFTESAGGLLTGLGTDIRGMNSGVEDNN